MNLWAIGDLHLSFAEDGILKKPMGIFGGNWENHTEKIMKSWQEKVSMEDFILIPGDFSWAMNLEELQHDISYLEELPGKKILLRGNHDYWWTSSKKMKIFLPERISFVQNNSFKINDNTYVCGTRGWSSPGDHGFSKEDQKIFTREISRLRLSLESVPKEGQEKEIIVMLHYPPTNMKHEYGEFIELLEEYQVKTCIYGHLHDASIGNRLPDEKWGISFILVSADAISFSPFLIKRMP